MLKIELAPDPDTADTALTLLTWWTGGQLSSGSLTSLTSILELSSSLENAEYLSDNDNLSKSLAKYSWIMNKEFLMKNRQSHVSTKIVSNYSLGASGEQLIPTCQLVKSRYFLHHLTCHLFIYILSVLQYLRN